MSNRTDFLLDFETDYNIVDGLSVFSVRYKTGKKPFSGILRLSFNFQYDAFIEVHIKRNSLEDPEIPFQNILEDDINKMGHITIERLVDINPLDVFTISFKRNTSVIGGPTLMFSDFLKFSCEFIEWI